MALIGMSCGVAVMSGVWLMQQALVGSIEQATGALVGQSTLRVEDVSGRLDEMAYRDLVMTPGAPELFPVIETEVLVADRTMTILGIDPLLGMSASNRLASTEISGALIGAEGAVVISKPTASRLQLSINDRLRVTHQQKEIDLEVIAVLDAGPVLSDYLVMDIGTAQDLFFEPGQLSAIEAPIDALSWIKARIPDDWNLQTPDGQAQRAADLSRGMRTNVMAMSLLALAVGLLVVYAVLSFLLVQRQKTLALMRAIGVRRAQIVTQLVGEVSILALLGGGLGLVLGTELAFALLQLVSEPYATIYGITPANTIKPTWGLYGLLWAATVAMALLAVTSILVEAFGVTPAQWVRSKNPVTKKSAAWTAIAGFALALGLALLVFSNQLMAALVGLFLVLMALSIVLPSWAFGALSLARNALGDGIVRRAWIMMLSARHRLVPALAALSLALALGAGIGMMVLGFRAAVDQWVDQLLQADVYVSSEQTAIDPQTEDQIKNHPDVAAISSVRRSRSNDSIQLLSYQLPNEAWAGFQWVESVFAPDDFQTLQAAFEAGLGVLVTEPLANKQGLSVGQRISIQAPTGPLQLEILGIYRDYASEQGAVAIDDAYYIKHWNDPLKDSLGLYWHPDRAVDDVDALLLSLNLPIPVVATTKEEIRRQTLAVFDETFRISWALAFLVGLIASLALVSALLAIGIERGREYATLRALGLSPRGLGLVVLSQTMGMALLALLLAIPLSLVIHLVLSLVIQPLAFGWHIPWHLPLGPWLVTVVVGGVVGLIAGIYPAWSINKVAPARLLRAL